MGLDRSNLRTLGRWVVPATVLSLAIAAIVFLGAVELSSEFGQSEDPAPLAQAKTARGEAQTAQLARPAEAPRLIEAPPPPSERRQAALTQPVSWRRPQPGAARSEGEGVDQAATLLARLARAKDLGSRLRLLDAHLQQLSPDRAMLELEGLLDGVLPGQFAEAEQLRLAVLARLGRYDDPRVEQALVRRLEGDLPRPQRLLALELLATRPHVGRGAMAQIASSDPDLVVQKKAAWALQHSR